MRDFASSTILRNPGACTIESSLLPRHAESRMFDLDASIHDYQEAGIPRPSRRRFVDQPQLHPDHFGAVFDGLGHDGGDGRGIAKDVHDFEWLRNFFEGWVALTPKDLAFLWIDGRNVIAMLGEVHRHGVARAVRTGREPYDCDAAVLLEDL